MADGQTIGGAVGVLALGIALGFGGGQVVDPDKPLAEATVDEMVLAKADSTTQALSAADKVREAGRDTIYDVKDAVYDKDGNLVSKAETLSVRTVDVPRAVQRPEQTLMAGPLDPAVPFRVVVYQGEKATAVWSQDSMEPPTANSELRAYVQVNIRNQAVR